MTNEILLESAVSLSARIREGRLSSAELVSACVDRITEVNSLINAVVDNRFEVRNFTLSLHYVSQFTKRYFQLFLFTFTKYCKSITF